MQEGTLHADKRHVSEVSAVRNGRHSSIFCALAYPYRPSILLHQSSNLSATNFLTSQLFTMSTKNRNMK